MKRKYTDKEIVMMVLDQMANMNENNVRNGNGLECFEGWCEDGDVFFTSYDDADEETIDKATKLMVVMSPHIDAITNICHKVLFENEDINNL